MAKFTNKKTATVPEVGTDQIRNVSKKLKKYKPTPTQGVDPVLNEIDDTYVELTDKLKEVKLEVQTEASVRGNSIKLVLKEVDEVRSLLYTYMAFSVFAVLVYGVVRALS